MKKLAIISTFILGLAATSCDSYLDINESSCALQVDTTLSTMYRLSVRATIWIIVDLK